MVKTKSEPKEASTESPEVERVVITKTNFHWLTFKIRGCSPFVQNKFSKRSIEEMMTKQESGSTATKGKKRKPKDFQQCYEDAQYRMEDGSYGLPASSFRNAAISACRLCGFKMTHAKLSIFTEADGYDKTDRTPLVKITKGKPFRCDLPSRLSKGSMDIHPRPMWDPGWEATVKMRFDADQFTDTDVANLMYRVGLQVGVGEGRHSSPDSNGMGWGEFEIVS